MSDIFIVWAFLLIMFICLPISYYIYMKKMSSIPWNIKRNEDYYPLVTILVPVFNEENIIQLKMENLMKINYPIDKLQILIVNDGSTDRTIHKISEYQKSNTQMKIQVINNQQRRGKTDSLNLALNSANGEVIVISDADCFWPPDTFHKALPFLSDPSVGAVTGLEVLLNPTSSWVTETEVLYNSMVHAIRVGESKFHSTIFFQGGFGAYKRSVLDQFDTRADDSGTALNIVQKGARTLLLPEAVYYTSFPSLWRDKISIKLRRAGQLVQIWFICLKLLIKGKLRLPKRIFWPETYLYLINPFIFLLLIPTSFLVILENPIFILFSLGILIATVLNSNLKIFLVESLQNQLVLLCALFSIAFKRNLLWNPNEASRAHLNREILKRKNLI